MTEQIPAPRSSSSIYQDYFEVAFAAADIATLWWQPLLKGLGRSNLELASLQSRNAQSWLQWSRAVASSRTPTDLIAANVGLCQSISGHIGEAIPKVSVALSDAAQPPATPIELAPLQVKRARDALVISGRGDDDIAAPRRERQVA